MEETQLLYPLIHTFLICCLLAPSVGAQDNSVLDVLQAFQKERAQGIGPSSRQDAIASLPQSDCGCTSAEGEPSVVESLHSVEASIKDEVKRASPAQKTIGQENQGQPHKAQEIKVLVFISSSMNGADLQHLAEAAPSHQAALVMRGLIEGNFKKTLAFVQSLKGTVLLDPRLFKAFGVEAVPTFVRLHEPLKIQGGKETFEVPPHDTIRGNLTL